MIFGISGTNKLSVIERCLYYRGVCKESLDCKTKFQIYFFEILKTKISTTHTPKGKDPLAEISIFVYIQCKWGIYSCKHLYALMVPYNGLDKNNNFFFYGAILHLFERLFLISCRNNRDCHITMPLSLTTMEVQIKEV